MIVLFTVLILPVILLNGWSSASGAITGCGSARFLSPDAAARLAAACTFAGAVLMPLINPGVAWTIYGIADFGEDSTAALSALCAGLCAVIVWSLVAFRFGIPNSETHALISGMTGAALARSMTLDAVNFREWGLVLSGFLLSSLLSFLAAFAANNILLFFFSGRNRRRVTQRFRLTQSFSAASGAALHGAQDCQKFMGVYMLGLSLWHPEVSADTDAVPFPVILICASVMTLGTLLGSQNVIKKLGCDMTTMDAAACSAASGSSSAVMALCTFLGLPASFTQSKACAIMGTGMCKSGGNNLRVVGQILGAWCLSFPVCGAIGFLFSFMVSHPR